MLKQREQALTCVGLLLVLTSVFLHSSRSVAEQSPAADGSLAGHALPAPDALLPTLLPPTSSAVAAGNNASSRPRPTAAPAPLPHSPHARYFVMLGSREGMSGWVFALAEAMTAAKQLGRVFVLPCVQSGSLVPCTDQVVDVPTGEDPADLAAVKAGKDVLALPTFRDRCNPGAAMPPSQGRVFPLHAYFAPSSIRKMAQGAGGVSYISHQEWVARAVAPEPLTAERTRLTKEELLRAYAVNSSATAPPGPGGWPDHAAFERLSSPPRAGFNFSAPLTRAAHDNSIIVPFPALYAGPSWDCKSGWTRPWPMSGGFWFPSLSCLPGERSQGAKGRRRGLEVVRNVALRLDPWVKAKTLFFCGWFRSLTSSQASRPRPFPRFNALHYPPVHRWLADASAAAAAAAAQVEAAAAARQQLQPPEAVPRGPRPHYVVLQWRSETVRGADFPGCLSAVKERMTQVASSLRLLPAAVRGAVPLILAADLPWKRPGVNTTCRSNQAYSASSVRKRLGSLTQLLAIPGVSKYDVGRDSTGYLVPDGAGWAVDSGVLAIRDYILAVEADWLVTCDTRHALRAPSALCSKCFWRSEFIEREVEHRAATGKSSFRDMWKMPPKYVFRVKKGPAIRGKQKLQKTQEQQRRERAPVAKGAAADSAAPSPAAAGVRRKRRRPAVQRGATGNG